MRDIVSNVKVKTISKLSGNFSEAFGIDIYRLSPKVVFEYKVSYFKEAALQMLKYLLPFQHYSNVILTEFLKHRLKRPARYL